MQGALVKRSTREKGVGMTVSCILCVGAMIMIGCVSARHESASADVQPLTLVDGGRAASTIVLPAETEWDRYINASPEDIEAFARERFANASDERLAEVIEKLPDLRQREANRVGDEDVLAVEELVDFVNKMSGAELPVVRLEAGATYPEGSVILLGADLARAAGLSDEIDALDPHGFLIRTLPNNLIIAGRTARGTLHGVYALLEHFGCRWVFPGPHGEIVPEKATLTANLNREENPSHPIHRYWWAQGGAPGKGFDRWMLRNKGTAVRALGDARINQSHASRHPMAWGAETELGQTQTIEIETWKRDENNQVIRDRSGRPVGRVRVEREVRRLPEEYYALVRGEISTHFANMANPKSWALHADYYRNRFYELPMEDVLSISAEDGIVDDDRPETRALDSYEYDWSQGAYSATDRLWFFHRRYLDAVREEHPDRRFGVLVYANNLMPPRIETVHPAMALVFAPLTISPLHHVRDEKSKTNRAYREWLESWMAQARAARAETYYYDYFPIGFQWSNFIISPQWQIIGRNYPWFHEMGLTGHTTSGFDDWGSQGLTHWVAVRLYWDVTQDYNDLVAEYCRFRFGERAAEAMHAYYRVFEHRMDEIPDMCSNEIWDNHLIIDAATRAAAREALAAAKPLVEGEREKAHFEMVELFQQAMDAWCDGTDHTRETGDFAAGAAMMAPAFEIRDQLNELYSHFVNPFNTDPDRNLVRRGLMPNLQRHRASGWYNKYRVWADMLAESGPAIVLPREMHVALDTDNLGWTRGWHKPEVSVDHLELWDTTQVPDIKYQTQREPAAFFYRTEVDVPAAFADHERVGLLFPSVIANAMRIWINGEPVQFDHGDYQDEIWRGPKYFWMNYVHTRIFDITPHIRPGEKNTVAFRVFKSFDHGGTYDRIFLVADPSEP